MQKAYEQHTIGDEQGMTGDEQGMTTFLLPKSIPNPIPSEAYAREIVREIEHHYPNLKGPLLTLLQSYKARLCEVGTINNSSEIVGNLVAKSGETACPHCGSTLLLQTEKQ